MNTPTSSPSTPAGALPGSDRAVVGYLAHQLQVVGVEVFQVGGGHGREGAALGLQEFGGTLGERGSRQRCSESDGFAGDQRRGQCRRYQQVGGVSEPQRAELGR
ncbi:hypothetical protein [Nocardia australiensis]|uniref:hypothetical protein n=1 Tax=Nocardia australiensis TaxID=2887191 RepID=UPI001D14BAD6|nr:hypothetical protein [Nocardia australiensis]